MKLKSFKEVIALSKEKFDESMAPLRAKTAESKANLLMAETDEKLAALEQKIQEATAKKDINFNEIADMMDDYALLELRKNRFQDIVAQLFPKDTPAGAA